MTWNKPRRPWALPLVPLYAAGLAAANSLRRSPQLLRWPVLSIGSLSAGGAGKTPAVIALAELLAANGFSPDILSRGYGRSPGDSRPATVNPDAANAATLFGDEPTLIAQRTGLPVWVTAERYAAGHAAEQSSAAAASPLHLLDDGFQHRRLARSLDILLLTAEDLDDTLLPAGNLREPLRALARADVLLLREDEAHEVTRRLNPPLPAGFPVWLLRRTLRFPEPLKVFTAGLRPLAFCAVARPADFAAALQAAGCGLLDTVVYPDHHAYTAADIAHLLATARQLGASGLITTEKDAVKLTPAWREQLGQAGPLMVAALDATFTNPAAVLEDIRARLQTAGPQ